MNNEKLVESVSRAQAGDGNAFAELFLTYKDASYYVAKKMFGDENKALNIVYETAISVFKQVKTLNPPSAFRFWAGMLLGNICKRRLPDADKALFAPNETDGALLGSLDDDANAPVSKAAFDNDDTKNMICAIADGLPADQKLCAEMYFLLGLKPEYIAQALGLTPVAVRNRLFGAINKIKEGMYGFEKNGERMYSVPQWLIAASFAAQASNAGMSDAMTGQVFAMASKYVYGVPLSAKAAIAAKNAAAPAPVAAPQAPVSDVPAQNAAPQANAQAAETVQYGEEGAQASANRLDFDSIKTRNNDSYAAGDEDDADEEDYKKSKKSKKSRAAGEKKKGKGGLVALIVVLAVVVLAAGAVFVLPKVTDGKIDPLEMVMGLFTDPVKELANAQNLLAEGNYEKAIASFNKVLEKDASNSAAYLGLISAYEGMGDTANQNTTFEKYFELAGRTSDIALYQKYIAIAGDRPIVWSDATVEQLVRNFIGKTGGDITPNELETVTSLVFTDVSGASCVDLLNFKNLSQISMKSASFTDMNTIFPLLTKLDTLDFESASLGEIPEVVANIPGLTSLTITNSGISNLAPLSALTQLTYLDLSNNQISDLTPLSLLSNVSSLALNNNLITDVEPLTTMENLRSLSIYGNDDIENIELFDDMETLETLVTEAPADTTTDNGDTVVE